MEQTKIWNNTACGNTNDKQYNLKQTTQGMNNNTNLNKQHKEWITPRTNDEHYNLKQTTQGMNNKWQPTATNHKQRQHKQ